MAPGDDDGGQGGRRARPRSLDVKVKIRPASDLDGSSLGPPRGQQQQSAASPSAPRERLPPVAVTHRSIVQPPSSSGPAAADGQDAGPPNQFNADPGSNRMAGGTTTTATGRTDTGPLSAAVNPPPATVLGLEPTLATSTTEGTTATAGTAGTARTNATAEGGGRPVPLDDKRSRALFVLKCGLIVGSCVCLAVLLLLTLARIKKKEMEEKEGGGGGGVKVKPVFVGGGGDAAAGASKHSVLGILAVPVAIGTVGIAGYMVLEYEKEVIARQRSRQNSWNWLKVGMICVIVGLGLGYKRVGGFGTGATAQPYRVSWRLFVYCILGVVAMALAKLTNRATRPHNKKHAAR